MESTVYNGNRVDAKGVKLKSAKKTYKVLINKIKSYLPVYTNYKISAYFAEDYQKKTFQAVNGVFSITTSYLV